MKMTKKKSLIAALLLVIANNTYTRDQNESWLNTVRDVLFGELQNINGILFPAPGKTNPFAMLPQEMRNKIVGLLIADLNAHSLQESIEAIQALAVVNKELNKLLNDPAVCLGIIKNLAHRFKLSVEKAAFYLGLKSSKERVALQEQLIKALEKNNIPAQDVLRLIQEGADVNFTMIDKYSGDNPSGISPLYSASFYPGPYSGTTDAQKQAAVEKVKILLENGANANRGRNLSIHKNISDPILDLIRSYKMEVTPF